MQSIIDLFYCAVYCDVHPTIKSLIIAGAYYCIYRGIYIVPTVRRLFAAYSVSYPAVHRASYSSYLLIIM